MTHAQSVGACSVERRVKSLCITVTACRSRAFLDGLDPPDTLCRLHLLQTGAFCVMSLGADQPPLLGAIVQSGRYSEREVGNW